MKYREFTSDEALRESHRFVNHVIDRTEQVRFYVGKNPEGETIILTFIPLKICMNLSRQLVVLTAKKFLDDYEFCDTKTPCGARKI